MPPRSAILSLPTDVRAELDRMLVASGFADYSALVEWLEEKGFTLSRSAVHRYGQRFEQRVGRMREVAEQAKALVAEVGDDAGQLGDALTMLAQQQTFELLMDLEVDPDAVDYPKLVKAIADLNRTSVAQKQWAQKVRDRAALAAKDVEEIAKRGGLSDEAADAIRSKILGIAK